jgi:pseudouridine-5'-phosphate glycosidase
VAERIRVHPEVAGALEGRRPVVALETTLIAHGFPAGEGADVGRAAQRAVREARAVPATIGVVDGSIRVGLGDEEIDRFGSSPEARKVGPGDLAACAARGELGATTVGGTLAVCRAVGIGFMATGGLGGVHRGYAERLDVSADLGELARTEALVVCSGAKSVLDVDATAEVLEALGIPVLGWHTDTFPRFYTADGGPPLASRVESAAEAAEIARIHWRLVRHCALVVARPPTENLEVDDLVVEAVRTAEQQRVRGRAVTPFLLARLHETSGGRTTEANKRLIAENATLAAAIAVAYAA